MVLTTAVRRWERVILVNWAAILLVISGNTSLVISWLLLAVVSGTVTLSRRAFEMGRVTKLFDVGSIGASSLEACDNNGEICLMSACFEGTFRSCAILHCNRLSAPSARIFSRGSRILDMVFGPISVCRSGQTRLSNRLIWVSDRYAVHIRAGSSVVMRMCLNAVPSCLCKGDLSRYCNRVRLSVAKKSNRFFL